MYCTGGIRCERASALVMNKAKANKVFQLEGGIHMYMNEYGLKGFWRGEFFTLKVFFSFFSPSFLLLMLFFFLSNAKF
jgi:predicted sulfurtransferase